MPGSTRIELPATRTAVAAPATGPAPAVTSERRCGVQVTAHTLWRIAQGRLDCPLAQEYGRRMSTTAQDTELKARHRAMWASGDYPSMVTTFLLPLGPRLVEACGIGPGTTVLDVAAG